MRFLHLIRPVMCVLPEVASPDRKVCSCDFFRGMINATTMARKFSDCPDENGEPHNFGSRRAGTFSTHKLVTRLDCCVYSRPSDERDHTTNTYFCAYYIAVALIVDPDRKRKQSGKYLCFFRCAHTNLCLFFSLYKRNTKIHGIHLHWIDSIPGKASMDCHHFVYFPCLLSNSYLWSSIRQVFRSFLLDESYPCF